MDIPGYLLNERYGDRYFDVVDALEEAKHIHIGGARIIERLSGTGRMRIGETGFGAGRILVSLMGALEEGGVSDAEITYSSVELNPISVDRMGLILGGFRPRAGRHIDSLAETYSRFDLSGPGWREGAVRGGFGTISLRLFIGEALDMARSLERPCGAWFLDGHAPSKNPDIWRAELLAAIGRTTEIGGTATAFTVAGQVRRDLKAAGFRVEKVPGHGGKREALLGVFEGSC
jgi:tRNA 5-methylaminomethyl-2-thiouridine biosynthesis bifunctional protein